jgi:hypothetical protein
MGKGYLLAADRRRGSGNDMAIKWLWAAERMVSPRLGLAELAVCTLK